MYTTYITEALVCGSRNSNTADRSYLLFTREAGMIYASARSVREERSKQRFALQEFSHVRATLVRGKGGWRIAGVEPLGNMYFETEDRERRKLLRNIVNLLRRVLQGDTAHQQLFDEVMASLRGSEGCECGALEPLLSLRVLRELGYVAPHEKYSEIFEYAYAYEGAPFLTEDQKEYCTRTVSEALAVSQL